MYSQFLLDDLPALLGMREDAARAVFHPGWKDREVARTGKQEERTVTEQTGVPVLQVVTGQEFAFEIDEALIVHVI